MVAHPQVWSRVNRIAPATVIVHAMLTATLRDRIIALRG